MNLMLVGSNVGIIRSDQKLGGMPTNSAVRLGIDAELNTKLVVDSHLPQAYRYFLLPDPN
jgi:hypothetical protein